MQGLYLSSIWSVLSPDRLGSYRFHGDDDVGVVSTYLWNVALCEALYPTLNGLEVALRNSLYNAGEQRFATAAKGEVACWLDADPPILAEEERNRVAAAKDSLRSRGKALDAPHLIAELTFGFWTALLDVRYEHRQVLWPHMLSAVFPAIPAQMRKRKLISSHLNRVRLLRNRAFHHEPIWHWRDLPNQYAATLELLQWISPALAATVALTDRFPMIHAAGRSSFRDGVERVMSAFEGAPAST
jgi:hypothetical protein